MAPPLAMQGLQSAVLILVLLGKPLARWRSRLKPGVGHAAVMGGLNLQLDISTDTPASCSPERVFQTFNGA